MSNMENEALAVLQTVASQSEATGLWGPPQTDAERQLQRALRQLHHQVIMLLTPPAEKGEGLVS